MSDVEYVFYDIEQDSIILYNQAQARIARNVEDIARNANKQINMHMLYYQLPTEDIIYVYLGEL